MLNARTHLLMAAINSTEELPRWVKGTTPDDAVQLYARPTILGMYFGL